MHTQEIKGNSVVILGYGREGKSLHAWLQKHYPNLQITIADKKKDGDGYLQNLHRYDSVIRSPGVSPYAKEIVQYIERGGHVTTATNIFFSMISGRTVGITGTKGKSTTTSLIAHILSAHFSDVRLVGNIGKPMLDEVDSSTPDTIFVIELSSHQLLDIRYSPNIAVLLNIVSEHLDYYPDFASYVSAKSNIVKFQQPSDSVVYNPEHIEVATIVERGKAGRHPFYSKDASFSPTHLLGNAENILAATAVARLFGVSDAMIKRQIGSFMPLPHRLEFVGEYKAIRFFNDSLSTIPEATIHALSALGSDVGTLIVGGYDRGLDYAELGAYLRNRPVQTLILLPDTGKKIWEAIGMGIPEGTTSAIMNQYSAHSMEDAVRFAYAHTPEGKICLLSPASASYNMFVDYADRGQQFKDWVQKLGT